MKEANNNYQINNLIKQRWSPRSFSEKIVDNILIMSLIEAARWSPSAYNSQPWRFIIGFKHDETYQKLFSTLVDFNKDWAYSAPVLIGASTQHLAKDGTLNEIAFYDLGQSIANLTLQAMDFGLYVHQMTGFERLIANQLFNLPANNTIVTIIAVGYLGDANKLPAPLKTRELAKRERINTQELIYADMFGEYKLVNE